MLNTPFSVKRKAAVSHVTRSASYSKYASIWMVVRSVIAAEPLPVKPVLREVDDASMWSCAQPRGRDGRAARLSQVPV